jgi:hypothetical protein
VRRRGMSWGIGLGGRLRRRCFEGGDDRTFTHCLLL